ncbi:MAG: type IV pilus secretin PilQ, partial [Desulfobacteraceae bacterium]
STITPPKFTKAKKNLASGTEVAAMGGEQGPQGTSSNMTMTQSGNKGTSAATGNNVKLNDERSLEELISGKPKTYTGKPIKIDFYETDIKNVFRILRTISGLNFAIDKNVSGKVTMTLDKPVPWDQVLDLVLKMNDLGKIQEGNVLRIARKATIKKEDKARREMIAAKRKELAERKSLEPLVTEYIPINYSDAAKDIKPHIDKILTKGRGKLSIDKRTNMLIITDTKDKIAQAKGIIYRLDRVTPQIMIEAKVVEVSDDFTKELGVGWLVNRNESADYTGQNYDYSVALNLPQGNNFGNFTFYRILGSMVTSLNAQIAASETKGDVKIVSSPRILTLDNKKASIKQGLEYAYLERDDTGGSSVKFKSIDLALDVTPHVTPDQRIAMQIKVTKNDIASITNGVPSLTTNEANTELLVNDNDTVIIGGVVKKSITTGTTGVPYLKHIPIVGQLFRTDTKNDRRNELMIFLTPKIVQLTQKENVLTTSTSLQ